MTPQLQAQLTSILSSVQETVKSTADMASAQLPELIQQILVYNFWIHSIYAIILYVFFLFFFIRFLCINSADKEFAELQAFLMLYSFPFVILTVWQASYVLQIWLAPKLFLLEYVSSFLQ